MRAWTGDGVRGLRRVAWAVALGAATTVVIAWVGAVCPRESWPGMRAAVLGGPKHAEMCWTEERWATTTVYSVYMADVKTIEPGMTRNERYDATTALPAWSWVWGDEVPESLREGADGTPARSQQLLEIGGGWPARALRFEADCPQNTSSPFTVRWGVQLGEIVTPGPGAVVPRALPLRPIWSGFAADAAVFGVAWWVLLVGWRKFTRPRGVDEPCARCGYELKGQAEPGCPECGAGRVRV